MSTSESLPDTVTLYQRINRVKADVVRVQKTGRNQHFGYNFATESDIADTLRPLMAEHGVCLCYHGPDFDRTKVEKAGTTKSGVDRYRYIVWCKYTVRNAQNPQECFETWGCGEALDQEDKGFNKAITAAHKYVLIKLFDVSTGDLAIDPDSSSHMDAESEPRQQGRPVPPAPAPEAAKQTIRQKLYAAVEKWSQSKTPEETAACVKLLAAKMGFKQALAENMALMLGHANKQMEIGVGFQESITGV